MRQNTSTLPNHLALVIDGNRRWGIEHGMSPWEGHRFGAVNVEKFLDWCIELGIPQISIYSFSEENWNRPKKEVKEFMDIYYETLEKWESEKFNMLEKYQVKVKFVGDLEKLPPKLLAIMGRLMRKTAKFQKKVINILVSYSAKYEIVNAFKNIMKKAANSGIEITQKDVEKNLLVPVPIDLVIRTGGRSRLSNFLLWQAAYAELYITKTLWPDFSKREFKKALKWFADQKRTFGS